jgi:hypothetical protein
MIRKLPIKPKVILDGLKFFLIALYEKIDKDNIRQKGEIIIIKPEITIKPLPCSLLGRFVFINRRTIIVNKFIIRNNHPKLIFLFIISLH